MSCVSCVVSLIYGQSGSFLMVELLCCRAVHRKGVSQSLTSLNKLLCLKVSGITVTPLYIYVKRLADDPSSLITSKRVES